MKDVLGYPGYIIYEDGRIYSLKRNIFMKTQRHYKGYEIVGLWHPEKKRKVVKVHRLLAQAYIPNPENKPQVDHKNRIKDDNRLENLRWVTNSENQLNCGLRKDNILGEANITLTKSKKYQFTKTINKVRFSKRFDTLEECKNFRDNYLTTAPVL